MMDLRASFRSLFAGMGMALAVAGSAYAQDAAKVSAQAATDAAPVSAAEGIGPGCASLDIADAQPGRRPAATLADAAAPGHSTDNLTADDTACPIVPQATLEAAESVAMTTDPASEEEFAIARPVAEAFAEAERKAASLSFSAGPPPRNLTRGRISAP